MRKGELQKQLQKKGKTKEKTKDDKVEDLHISYSDGKDLWQNQTDGAC
jgi:hypothetical protein